VALTAGTTIGSYEVLAFLGAGGMGEVYRARDLRLGRQVALKMLPETAVAHADRRARLLREAQVLATLNHPNISTLHGVEEVGNRYVLVLELVDGDTVGARLGRAAGPLPLREILSIARQLIDALDAAHDKGIVHRDLKPENIVVRPDATVKVLDFGVAKVLGALAGDEEHAATITEVLPGAGPVMVGTPAYMSPEQIRGETVTPATDVWAFGCVLYAMLTGRRAFGGETRRETLTQVLETDPDFTQLPADLPLLVQRLVRRCLEKDPRARLRHIADARAYLDDSVTAPTGQFAIRRRVRGRVALWAGAAAIAGLAAGGAAVWFLKPAEMPRTSRTIILTEPPALLAVTPDKSVAVTHDGTRVVYVGSRGTQIFLRPLDALAPESLVTATGGLELRGLAISPDDRWLAYVENSFTLRKVALTGGPSIALTTVDAPYRGGTWDRNGGIIFSTASAEKGLQRVSAEGGAVTVLTRPDRSKGEAAHFWPVMLPDGRGVLFTIMPTSGDRDLNAAHLAVFDLPSGTIKTVMRGGRSAWYVNSGHLVFAAERELRAIAFDLQRREVRGTAVSVVPQLVGDNLGGANFSVSANGTLVYPQAVTTTRQMVWVDRHGKETVVEGVPRNVPAHPRVSPRDADRVAFSTFRDLYVWRQGGALVQLTFSPFASWMPLWLPDGQRLLFGSWRGGNGVSNLFLQTADGAGSFERLTDSRYMQLPSSITPDGSAALFTTFGPPGGPDIRLVRLAGANRRQEEPVLETPQHERNAAISPDGRWMAYESNGPGATGQLDVHVRRFPVQPDGTVWQVSSGGGTHPLWSPAGGELFYVAADGAMMAVRADTAAERWAPGTSTQLFRGTYVIHTSDNARHFDVTADGKRFVMVKQEDPDRPRPLVVVQGWGEELKRRVQ
jgi:serine/threonine-protein kinase